MVSEPFLHEDLSKPENRINLAIFGLMCDSEFRTWLQGELRLPPDSIIYPPVNLGSIRPDFVVHHAGSETTIGWIEVESATNPAQLARYRTELSEPVYAIWGRRADGADSRLEAMADFLRDVQADVEPQVRWNARHLRAQIEEALSGRVGMQYPAAAVSDAVRAQPFVRALESALDVADLYEDVGRRLRPGQIRANTRKERGFSLRVFSKLASERSVRVLSQSGGQPEVRFPSTLKLNKYLPGREDAVERLARVVEEMGGDMRLIGELQSTSVRCEAVENNAVRLAATVHLLASR